MNLPKRIVRILTADRIQEFSVNALTAIGGRLGSGIRIDTLKQTGDYAVIAPSESGVALHPLRGSGANAAELGAGHVFRLEDLCLWWEIPTSDLRPNLITPAIDPFAKILTHVAGATSWQTPLSQLLKEAINLCGHHHGLVISQSLTGKYEILAGENIDPHQSWFSESLIQRALANREPVILESVAGSEFDTQKSIIATLFRSVFCSPLIVHGSVIGLLITGNAHPFGGSFTELRSRLQSFVNLAALFLDFRLRELRLQAELEDLRGRGEDRPFLTENPALIAICEMARKVARSDLSVLVQGETGVGKEVLSRWIHQQSDRAKHPFIAINCAAIPGELLETTLFGHKRGAFTGASRDHLGKIQQADGGTLFLDEIGDLPLLLQAKLLRVLQEGTVDPVGSTKPIEVDVRVICASHRKIRKMSAAGEFREDLYYRLAQVTLAIPPLRERVGDLRILSRSLLHDIDPTKRFTPEAWNWIFAQSWPGNVRELKSAIHRAAILANGDEIRSVDFKGADEATDTFTDTADSGPSWLGATDLETAKQKFIRQKIHRALEVTEGNRTKAAELLGVTSRTLFRYLENGGEVT